MSIVNKDEAQKTEIAIFGAGCFWQTEEFFRQLPGVIETLVGYSGGHVPNPTYEDVCRGDTGHAEVLRITYDPAKISFEELLKVFWEMHDPTEVDRQGPDIGRQYRSVIFYNNEEQKKSAENAKNLLQASGKYSLPIATEIVPAQPFYSAEEYHQKYLAKRGLNVCH